MAKGNFIDYIVSNDPNKYPSDGEQGGYYYQMFDSSTLIPANIKQGVNIFGVEGELLEVTVTIDGVKQSGNFALTRETEAVLKKLTNFPISTENYLHAVVFNDEIHAISVSKHYKYNFVDSSWELVGTNPSEFYEGDAVVYNNEIHFIDGDFHYKYDGVAWTKIKEYSGLSFGYKSAVVYDNKIHCLGVYDSTYGYKGHYTVDGTTKKFVSALPFNYENTDGIKAVVYNNEIHVLYSTDHYKWDGKSWTKVSTIPYSFTFGGATVFNDEIYIAGSQNSTYQKKYYKWDGASWTSLGNFPISFYKGELFTFNNMLYSVESTYTSFYQLRGLYLRGEI